MLRGLLVNGKLYVETRILRLSVESEPMLGRSLANVVQARSGLMAGFVGLACC